MAHKLNEQQKKRLEHAKKVRASILKREEIVKKLHPCGCGKKGGNDEG